MELLLDVIEESRGDGQVAAMVPATMSPGNATIFLLVILVVLLFLFLFLLLPVAKLVPTRGVVMVGCHAAVHGGALVFRCLQTAAGQSQWPSTGT
jgi:protein-S-isoprenylcysteine O-methyltransferase Ste14